MSEERKGLQEIAEQCPACDEKERLILLGFLAGLRSKAIVGTDTA